MYLEFMVRETRRFGVKILASCLMTNHVHLIAVPKDAGGLVRVIGEAYMPIPVISATHSRGKVRRGRNGYTKGNEDRPSLGRGKRSEQIGEVDLAGSSERGAGKAA